MASDNEDAEQTPPSPPKQRPERTIRYIDNDNTRFRALLVFVPIALLAGLLGLHSVTVFVLNIAALVSLTSLIDVAVLELTKDAGVGGGLLRGILGSPTELILGITAIWHGENQLAQWIMIGSTLSYSLFVLGSSLLYSSIGKDKEIFNKTRMGVMSSLVMVTSVSLTIPTVMSATHEDVFADGTKVADDVDMEKNIAALSHVTATVLFFLFLFYLVFRFRTHRQLYPPNTGTPLLTSNPAVESGEARIVTSTGLPWTVQGLTFIIGISCAALCSRVLVRDVEATTKALHVTKSFVGLVILPPAGILTKSITIIRHARGQAAIKTETTSRLDFAIRSVMSNVLDTLLFNLPVLVLVGWAIGQPMILEFGLFDAVVFIVAILIMTYLMQHGKTTYFEGIMLMGTYVSIAIAFYLRPEAAEATYAAWR